MNQQARKQHSDKKHVLLLYGGWKGHKPELFAEFAKKELLKNYRVTCTRDLNMLRADVLKEFDLILPIWTFGKLSDAQESELIDAVANGLGLAAWHGNASAFLENRPFKFMLGGQFVGHPGGDCVTYPIHFLNNDPLVYGLKDFTVTSEQYYLLVDPAVKVLATTIFSNTGMSWINGVQMPIAWKRNWGKGRVFYCALGHTLNTLNHPTVLTLFDRALQWTARSS